MATMANATRAFEFRDLDTSGTVTNRAHLLLQPPVVLAGFFLITALWYGFNVSMRWKLRKLPGPRPSFLIGNMLDDPMATWHHNLIKWPKQYGMMTRYFYGRDPYILCSDPALIYEASVKKFTAFHDRKKPVFPPSGPEDDERTIWEILWSQGKFWSKIRAAADPLFHTAALASYVPLMHEAIDRFVVELSGKHNEPIEIAAPLRDMTLQVIGSAAFGVDFLGTSNNQLGEASMTVIHPGAIPTWVHVVNLTFPAAKELVFWFLRNFTTKNSRIAWFFRANGYLLGASKALLKSSRMQFDGSSEEHILPSKAVPPGEKVFSAREIQLKAQDKGYADFQDMVPRENSFFHKLLHTSLNKDVDGEDLKLNETQIIPQAIVFILAGFDTTATNLSFTMFELAKYQAAQDRIRAEIAAFDSNPDNPEQLEVRHLVHFPFTQACMLESLRLHPPVHPHHVQQRIAVQDTQLGEYKIPKGVTVVMNTHGVAHNPEIYPDPEAFIPERFLKESRGQLVVESPGSFLSFGVGPHRCIGFKFAIQEGVFALVAIHRKIKYELSAKHHGKSPKMEYMNGLVFAPTDGVWLNTSPA